MENYLVIVRLNTGANLLFKGAYNNPSKAIRDALFQLTEDQDNMVVSAEAIQIINSAVTNGI